MRIIEIAALDNGAHRNQTGTFSAVPDGWAVIPESIVIPETFPFVDIEVYGKTVVAMTAGTVPEPEQPSPAKLREEAYNANAIIDWNGEMLTVTQAAQLWQYYSAEGASGKTLELTQLISEAKATIRKQYHDEEE